MRIFFLPNLMLAALSIACSLPAFGKEIKPPTVFLDKSPRIVAYQLGRLGDQRLLLVPRADDDSKYIPVYEAILSRPAMSEGIRDEAIDALAKLKDTSPAAEILTAIEAAEPEDAQSKRSLTVLTRMLLDRPIPELTAIDEALIEACNSEHAWLRPIGYAARITAGKGDAARKAAAETAKGKISLMKSIEILPSKDAKVEQRDFIVDCFASAPDASIRAAAIDALSRIPAAEGDTFTRLVPLVQDDRFRFDACRAILRLPQAVFDADQCATAAGSLVEFAEATEASQRTTDAFIDAMQVVDRMLRELPAETARSYRDRLREITVRVVRIGTVEEEMRYDKPYFAVEAGRSVQIVLENHDLMPHNLVITQPGALRGVAMAGLAAGPDGTNGLSYVPDSPNVIAASEMVAPDQSARITLTAPEEPGEYPYVCTFPQHWYRMYGVMVVVEDLEAWNQNPTEPANPLGSNRSFVQAWQVDDFEGAFDSGLAGRAPTIGEKIFNEASCVGCHQVNGTGGKVGPDLTEVYKRWKFDHEAILREILDPSYKIDPKYAMQIILTTEGKTVTGILVDEDDDKVTLLTNPEAKEPVVIAQDDIEIMKRSQTSMMPKALMDQYTKEEVIELMAYLHSLSKQ